MGGGERAAQVGRVLGTSDCLVIFFILYLSHNLPFAGVQFDASLERSRFFPLWTWQ